MESLFDLTDRTAVITGGAGFMGTKHAEIIALYGGIPIIVDLPEQEPEKKAIELTKKIGKRIDGITANIIKQKEVASLYKKILEEYGKIDILINNAANNPKVGTKGLEQGFRFENLPFKIWENDLAVTLTGSFLCCQVFGAEMARRKKGVILNVSSDLSVIAPDQRLYRKEGLPDHEQPTKPVTYSVAKTGLIGLTRYLAAYWGDVGVRVNAISPGGVYNNQPEDFVKRLSQLIPMKRMAKHNEWQGAVLFLCSDASSYITGINIVIDGGRSIL